MGVSLTSFRHLLTNLPPRLRSQMTQKARGEKHLMLSTAERSSDADKFIDCSELAHTQKRNAGNLNRILSQKMNS